MKNVYTIPENERENVLKLLTRYGKKAAAYGQPLSYEMGEPYATEIKVRNLTPEEFDDQRNYHSMYWHEDDRIKAQGLGYKDYDEHEVILVSA